MFTVVGLSTSSDFGDLRNSSLKTPRRGASIQRCKIRADANASTKSDIPKLNWKEKHP